MPVQYPDSDSGLPDEYATAAVQYVFRLSGTNPQSGCCHGRVHQRALAGVCLQRRCCGTGPVLGHRHSRPFGIELTRPLQWNCCLPRLFGCPKPVTSLRSARTVSGSFSPYRMEKLGLNKNNARIALADGASESAFAREWARILTAGFAVTNPPDMCGPVEQSLAVWLKPRQEEWNRLVPWERIPLARGGQDTVRVPGYLVGADYRQRQRRLRRPLLAGSCGR